MRRMVLGLTASVLAACASAGEVTPNPAFAALETRIRGGEFGDTHSLMVVRDGVTVEEAYFAGADERRGQPLGHVNFTPATLHDARSISKTVVAVLYGIALSEGRVPALDTPAIDAFPEYAELATPERRRVTIGHLLTMTSGFAWDEFTHPYQDPRNSETAMDAAPDPLRYVFEQSFAHTPGTQWAYSGGDVAVVAAILERGTGTPLHAYARQVLFEPLGIGRSEWTADAQGRAYAASGLRLTPRDFAKFGLLIERQGAWEGRQIAPSSWVADMTSPHATVGGPPPCGVRYGYFTWLSAVCAPGAPPALYAAGIGYGGQRLFAFSEEHIIIVINAGNYADPQQNERATTLMMAAFQLVR